ncbi:ATP synthase F0 subunit 8 (mitochondrion) [Cyanidioschyzon merolae]|jgi:hypothetical protein|uniref:ATP synthase A chain (Protein 8) n=2 Tax=Cyanidioschyzon merolae TaxID=45157 RepID=Q9ZZP9_CYAM1|nr:ATP synthase F0 subunit 8 [Cyanidioschyzon merolae]BAA36525.1 ATP synthase A chain (protein 8) [Cyanidioschyzon merolae strain 10D]BBU60046.1 ATP synthase F0 subunit 8 [Cyanidioschyzon merolae]
MPQLDRVIIVTQIFWLLLIMIVAYSFVIKRILPSSFRILKIRENFIKDLILNVEKLNKEQNTQLKNTIKLNQHYINLIKNIILVQNKFYDEILSNYYKIFIKKINLKETFFTYASFMQLYKNLIQRYLIN